MNLFSLQPLMLLGLCPSINHFRFRTTNQSFHEWICTGWINAKKKVEVNPKLKRRLQYNFSNKQGSIVNQSSAGLTIFCYLELKPFYFADFSLDLHSCEVIILACPLSYFFLLFQIVLDVRRSVTRATRESIFLHFILYIYLFFLFLSSRADTGGRGGQRSFILWPRALRARHHLPLQIQKYANTTIVCGELWIWKHKKSSVLEGQNASEC